MASCSSYPTGEDLLRRLRAYARRRSKDKAGVVAPPPLIYLAALVLFGLLLNRRSPTTPFVPRTIARLLEVADFLAQELLLAGWFEWAMRRADTPTNPYKPGLSHCHGGTVWLPATPLIFR